MLMCKVVVLLQKVCVGHCSTAFSVVLACGCSTVQYTFRSIIDCVSFGGRKVVCRCVGVGVGVASVAW